MLCCGKVSSSKFKDRALQPEPEYAVQAHLVNFGVNSQISHYLTLPFSCMSSLNLWYSLVY